MIGLTPPRGLVMFNCTEVVRYFSAPGTQACETSTRVETRQTGLRCLICENLAKGAYRKRTVRPEVLRCGARAEDWQMLPSLQPKEDGRRRRPPGLTVPCVARRAERGDVAQRCSWEAKGGKAPSWHGRAASRWSRLGRGSRERGAAPTARARGPGGRQVFVFTACLPPLTPWAAHLPRD